MPCKVQGIFAVGKPVIFVGCETGELAQWILESRGGWVVPENDIQALLRAIEEARYPAERARRGVAARQFAGKNFNMDVNRTLIAELLEAQ